MKKLALSVLICSVSAFATTVSYSTTGLFASDGSSSVTNGDATISFTGDTANVTAPTFSSLGTFTVTGNVGGTFTDNFTLTITQSVPSSGSGTSSTVVNGTITGDSSTIELIFVPSSVTIGSGGSSATYTFSPPDVGINNPEDNGGITTIQAFITTSPEPATLGLIGASLLGLGVLVRRRAKK